MGYDITSLFKGELSAEYCFDEENDVHVTIGYLSTKLAAEAVKKCTKKVFNKKTRQSEEEIDNLKATKEIAKHTLLGWRGFIVDGEDLEYNQENRDNLIVRFTELSEFVTERATDHREMIEKQREQQRKNLSSMSNSQ